MLNAIGLGQDSECLGNLLTTNLVDILLATYNGAAYLQEQLQSLLEQSYTHYRVLVHDDGSSDGTVDVIKQMQPLFEGRLVFIQDGLIFKGAVGNFGHLMAYSNSDASAQWIAFCDQDDVWLPHKLAVMVKAIESLQHRALGRPCLVFSDLCVVDAKLRTINPSFWAHERIDPSHCTLGHLLNRNVVTGCAMLVNRKLLEVASPVPGAAVMHDWWCALLATAGSIGCVAEPLVLYRQHANNRLGAKSRGPYAKAMRLLTDRSQVLARVRALGQDTYCQAAELRVRLAQWKMPVHELDAYLSARSGNLWHRIRRRQVFCTDMSVDNLFRLLFWNRSP